MTYSETIKYLYAQHPAFERQGGDAYKPGLQTSIDLAELFQNPQNKYKTIHVAGTNGKGSVSHLIASVLQLNGYKVGLYTSPHLVDFRERIRVNGKMIPEEKVMEFIKRYENMHYNGKPSFFELTSTMAFDYFAQCNVDYAVIEVGLGGRLDSTNIIAPILSVITNISFDHTQFLGNTLAQIATEKAGIIKHRIPVVIGEADNIEVRKVFENKALEQNSQITFAQDAPLALDFNTNNNGLKFNTEKLGVINCELTGEYQIKNASTVLTSIETLKRLDIKITDNSIRDAFANVCELTGLMGRWTTLSNNPRVICDTGHNVGGFSYTSKQLSEINCNRLHIIIGFVKDKDIKAVLDLLPDNATYYFTQAQTERALPAKELMLLGENAGHKGMAFDNIADAYQKALKNAAPTDVIFIGGSTYVVAELLEYLQEVKY